MEAFPLRLKQKKVPTKAIYIQHCARVLARKKMKRKKKDRKKINILFTFSMLLCIDYARESKDNY